ncbi:MAG: hypothetical protein IT234_06830 [Bacteroidia bacterium]|nr:hypothetical protein [Bacteroidia bacterium]
MINLLQLSSMNYRFLFLLFIAFQGFAQEPDYSSIPDDFKLTDKQYSAWRSIYNQWMVNDYETIQFENKIKMNCKSCTAFYMDVVIKVNASGKLEYYKAIDGKKCGIGFTKQLEQRMMKNFLKFEFPPELRNLEFKTRLGTSLKC